MLLRSPTAPKVKSGSISTHNKTKKNDDVITLARTLYIHIKQVTVAKVWAETV